MAKKMLLGLVAFLAIGFAAWVVADQNLFTVPGGSNSDQSSFKMPTDEEIRLAKAELEKRQANPAKSGGGCGSDGNCCCAAKKKACFCSGEPTAKAGPAKASPVITSASAVGLLGTPMGQGPLAGSSALFAGPTRMPLPPFAGPAPAPLPLPPLQ